MCGRTHRHARAHTHTAWVIYWQELAHVIMRSFGWKVQNLRGKQAAEPRLSWCCSSTPQAAWRQTFFFLGAPLSFFSWGLHLTVWTNPTHIMDSNLPYSKSTDLKSWSHRKNSFSTTRRLVLEHLSVYHGLAKLTPKINHHGQFKLIPLTMKVYLRNTGLFLFNEPLWSGPSHPFTLCGIYKWITKWKKTGKPSSLRQC